MRLLSFILAASIALAVLQAAAKVVAVVAIIAALAAFISRPQETIGCVTCFLLLGLVGRFPFMSMLLLTALAIIGWKADSLAAASDKGAQKKNEPSD